MPLNTFLERVRRASERPPGYVARRLLEMAASRVRRPWTAVYPRFVSARAIAGAAGAQSVDAMWDALLRGPFLLTPSDRETHVRAFRERYPDGESAVVAFADRALRHEFDLLGSGCVQLGPKLPWHTDFKTGREWPLQYAPAIDYSELDRPTDVKVPWELSRCQHFTALGQAYWLTGDERYAQEFVAEAEDWIERNPWGQGVNWACAMDVALRAVSWIWGFYFMGASAACTSPAFRSAFLRSLYLHGEWIATHLERSDINGNHYLCDGVGLVFVGAFFRRTRKGRKWLASGKDIIFQEIFNQTSDDGVDFEKSTAYHRLVLEAFLTPHLLLCAIDDPLPAKWIDRLERMIAFVDAYTKPDGTIPLVGDADDGRVQKLGPQALNDHRYLLSTGAVLFRRGDFKRTAGCFCEESFWMLGPSATPIFDALEVPAAPPESAAFESGGFYVLRSARVHVFVDCGEVGMRGRGGHGHNDITSLEIWLDGVNFVTDCGSYVYTPSREWRNAFRSTAFHNVVQIDGEELNRFISPDHLWQLRDDARPREVEWRFGPGMDYFRGGHTGYERLSPPVDVRREVWFRKEDEHSEVWLRDTIGGTGTRELVWRFHFGSEVHATISDGSVQLVHGNRTAWLQPVADRDLPMGIEKGWVSTGYGVRTPIDVMVMTARVPLPFTASFRIGAARSGAVRHPAVESAFAH